MDKHDNPGVLSSVEDIKRGGIDGMKVDRVLDKNQKTGRKKEEGKQEE